MDEADQLCDRVAILSLGRLRCLGSPLFLKALFLLFVWFLPNFVLRCLGSPLFLKAPPSLFFGSS